MAAYMRVELCFKLRIISSFQIMNRFETKIKNCHKRPNSERCVLNREE